MEKRIEACPELVEGGAAYSRTLLLPQPAPFDTASTAFRPTQDACGEPRRTASLAFAAIVLLVLLWDKMGSYFLTAPKRQIRKVQICYVKAH